MTCSGAAFDCFGFFDQFSCMSQEGCYWDSGTNSCSGSALPCEVAASCLQQRGCAESCSGIETPCSDLSATSCTLQPGCQSQ
jgi:hypothetical protein